MFVSDGIMSSRELQLAVSGLSGIVGFLLIPTVGRWIRLLLGWLESDRSALGNPKRISGVALLSAMALTFLMAFFLIALGKAAGDLREIRVEAPVFITTLKGAFVGIAIWVFYAVVTSSLRDSIRRQRQRQRFSPLS